MGRQQGKPPSPMAPLVTPVHKDDRDSDPPTGSKDPGDLAAGEATLHHEIQRHIGRKLKALYSDLVDQPVPERFQRLLEELERREKSK